MKNHTRDLPLAAAVGLAVIFSSIPAIASEEKQSGAALFETHCASCHLGQERGDDRVAPPVFGVQNHYFGQHTTKEAFVSAIVEWLEEPSEEKTLMPGAISKFGLMPPVELSDDERVALGEFLYSAKFDVPGWYEQHYREEHGEAPPSGGMQMQRGQGKGMGQGHQNGQGQKQGQKQGHKQGQGMGQGMGQHGGKAGHGNGQGQGWWQRLWGE